MSKEMESALKKVEISHELMAYQFNQYLNKNDSGYMVCINPEWEYELNTIKQALQDKDKRIKELEEEAKCNLKLANDWSDKVTQLQSKINNIQELLDLTPEDIRDVAVYTYQELNEILKENNK